MPSRLAGQGRGRFIGIAEEDTGHQLSFIGSKALFEFMVHFCHNGGSDPAGAEPLVRMNFVGEPSSDSPIFYSLVKSSVLGGLAVAGSLPTKRTHPSLVEIGSKENAFF